MAALVSGTLARLYPLSEASLEFRNPWQLLQATILAAQCADARVNTVTPELFRRWPRPEDLANAPLEEIEALIRPTGFYHNKAKSLKACAKILAEKFNGELPKSMEELVKLPGVARKTANVVLFGGFGINEGIAVDTHVRRISFRLGLTASQDPLVIERDLTALFPRPEWGVLNLRMVAFGRDICKARKPACQACPLDPACPKTEPSRKKPEAIRSRL